MEEQGCRRGEAPEESLEHRLDTTPRPADSGWRIVDGLCSQDLSTAICEDNLQTVIDEFTAILEDLGVSDQILPFDAVWIRFRDHHELVVCVGCLSLEFEPLDITFADGLPRNDEVITRLFDREVVQQRILWIPDKTESQKACQYEK